MRTEGLTRDGGDAGGGIFSSLIPSVSCRRCSPNAPFARLEMLTAERNKPLHELTDEELVAIAARGDSDDEPEADPDKFN